MIMKSRPVFFISREITVFIIMCVILHVKVVSLLMESVFKIVDHTGVTKTKISRTK